MNILCLTDPFPVLEPQPRVIDPPRGNIRRKKLSARPSRYLVLIGYELVISENSVSINQRLSFENIRCIIIRQQRRKL